MAEALGDGAGDRVEWMSEYRNQDIVPDVFDRCDAIVVPSIWAENSPLVIHEALQAGVPVITADYGGMAEYVGHEQNGLLFYHRDPKSLAAQMQRLVDAPSGCNSWGAGATCSLATATCRTWRSTPRRLSGSTPSYWPNEAPDEPPTRNSKSGRAGRGQYCLQGAVAHHLRHQPRRLQPALHHVRGPLALQQHPA